jgi:hypothetical protein
MEDSFNQSSSAHLPFRGKSTLIMISRRGEVPLARYTGTKSDGRVINLEALTAIEANGLPVPSPTVTFISTTAALIRAIVVESIGSARRT